MCLGAHLVGKYLYSIVVKGWIGVTFFLYLNVIFMLWFCGFGIFVLGGGLRVVT